MLTHPADRSVRLAWIAVLCGGLLASLSLWYEGRCASMPEDAVATVDGHPLSRAQWLRAVEAVEGDRGTALDAAGRHAILQRLVDEELLYQHALDSGLARDDPGLRKTLIAGLIDAATAGGAVDEAAARALFDQDPAYFSAQPRLRVAADGIELAAQALPLSQWMHRLGGSAAEALRRAALNQPVGPFLVEGRPQQLMVLERQADAPRYEDVAEAVRSEWSRREAEAALARLLADLRQAAVIRVADDAH